MELLNLLKTLTLANIEQHETCKGKCRLDASVCNNKQRWNDDRSRCECKELIDKGACDKGCTWNTSDCECECDKSCDVDEYLDYENCKCRKTIVDKLVAEYAENIVEVKIAWHENVCVCSYTICVILAVIALAISTGIDACFAYSHWYLKKDIPHVKSGTRAQTTI